MFKLQSPSKYSPFDIIHLSRLFPTGQNSFWPHWFWCLLVLLLFFCFTSSTSAKHFPAVTFHPRNHRKATWGETGWTERAEHLDPDIFSQKRLNTQHGVGRCAHKSPFMKQANESSKKIHWSRMQPHNTTSWYVDTDGFLEYSPTGGKL